MIPKDERVSLAHEMIRTGTQLIEEGDALLARIRKSDE